MEPSPTHSSLDPKAIESALALFRKAALRVPAYKDFLKKNGVKPEAIVTKADFERLPLTDKENYIAQYTLEDLSWDGTLNRAQYISTSSGSTGEPFFWPWSDEQIATSGFLLKQMYEKIFNTKNGKTLYVNSFGLGTWIAGFEHYNATRLVASQGNVITISTPGIDKQEAIREIKKLYPLFSRVILAGYAPFIKDVIETGKEQGIEWGKIDLYLLTVGEAISEMWRERVLRMIGKEGSVRNLINLYGMADAGGAVAYETPVSILFKQSFLKLPHTEGLPDPNSVTGIFQFFPVLHYFEGIGDILALTVNSGLPLVRYSTRDNGGVLNLNTSLQAVDGTFSADIKKHRVLLGDWQLPIVYLQGRKDLSMSFYALKIYFENVRSALENTSISDKLSGIFVIGVDHTTELDPEFKIAIELSQDVEPSIELVKILTQETVRGLSKVNSEYSKLHSEIGDRANPQITLIPFGKIETVPGKKHKWVKRG